MSIPENQDVVSNELLSYSKELEQLILEYAKFDIFKRKAYERKIKNLAQLAIIKGIDIQDIAKEINQEKKNELLMKKPINELNEINYKEKEQNINTIEINEIANQILCKDFYRNLSKFMQRKKDSLKITNLFNNANKIIHNNSNIIQNKFKNQFEQNYTFLIIRIYYKNQDFFPNMQHETSTKSFLFVFFFKPSLGFCRSEKHFFSLPLLVNASLDDILETGNFRVPILFKSNFAFLILLLLYNI